MLKIKKVTDVENVIVYTEMGDLFGEVDEGIVTGSKIFGWKIRATRNSALNKMLGGAKGVIVPHQLVRSIGDVMVISKSAVQSYDGEVQETA